MPVLFSGVVGSAKSLSARAIFRYPCLTTSSPAPEIANVSASPSFQPSPPQQFVRQLQDPITAFITGIHDASNKQATLRIFDWHRHQMKRRPGTDDISQQRPMRRLTQCEVGSYQGNKCGCRSRKNRHG
jgi:hypothetical protein